MNTKLTLSLDKNVIGVTEGIKWGNDLCFMVDEKMFCVAALDSPLKISFKVRN